MILTIQCSVAVGSLVDTVKLDGEEPISGREAAESGNLSTKYFFHQLSPPWEEWELGGGGAKRGQKALNWTPF